MSWFSKAFGFIVGAVEITVGALTGQMWLVGAGIGQILSATGTLFSKGPLQGISTATRNPVASEIVGYGRARVGGIVVPL